MPKKRRNGSGGLGVRALRRTRTLRWRNRQRCEVKSAVDPQTSVETETKSDAVTQKEPTERTKTVQAGKTGRDIREIVFNYRSYTPIPLLIVALVLARPSWRTILAGGGLMFVGEFWRIWGVRYAGGATRTTSGVGGEKLVTAGPFAYLRNPLYLGNFFNALGLCVAAWAWMPWMLLVCVAFFAIQYSLIVSLEEEYLGDRFGRDYERYAQAVPRFLPRRRPWPEAQVEQPETLKRTLRTERSTLGSLILITLLIILRWKLL